MNIGTLIYTWIFGNLVAKDELGNKYYCNSKNFKNINSKRWVIFSNEIEASNIPAQWHAWLHKTIDIPPINYKHKYGWQKNHIPNMTGTKDAYFPDSHPLSKVKNYTKKKEYVPWKP